MFKPRQPREIAAFDYMRYAKRMEYTPGYFLAGSAMSTPSPEEVGYRPEDFTTSSLCHNYGDPRAIELLRARYKAKPENIAITSGSSQGNALTCLALLEPGDEVIAEYPSYAAFRLLPPLYHGKVIHLNRREENGFLPDPAELRRLLTPRTRLVVLSNLHNPTLASIPPALLRELIAISAANNTYVLVDEVYLDHLKPGAHDPTCLHYGENVIATSSLTKVYGLGTLRFGWCLAPSNVIERILELQDLVDPELPAICQNLGVRALVNMERLRKRTRAAHERGLPVIKQWAASRKDITLFEAQGGVTAAIKIRGVADSWKLAEHLAYKHRVTVAPGAAFGMDSWLRVNIGKEPEELRRALDTLGKGIDAFVSK